MIRKDDEKDAEIVVDRKTILVYIGLVQNVDEETK